MFTDNSKKIQQDLAANQLKWQHWWTTSLFMFPVKRC